MCVSMHACMCIWIKIYYSMYISFCIYTLVISCLHLYNFHSMSMYIHLHTSFSLLIINSFYSLFIDTQCPELELFDHPDARGTYQTLTTTASMTALVQHIVHTYIHYNTL